MFEIDGLDEMSIEARSERAFAICRLTIPCNCNQHRVSEVRSLPQLLGHDITVQLRQSNIEDDRRPCAATMGHPSMGPRRPWDTHQSAWPTMGHPSIGAGTMGHPSIGMPTRHLSNRSLLFRRVRETRFYLQLAFRRNSMGVQKCSFDRLDGCPKCPKWGHGDSGVRRKEQGPDFRYGADMRSRTKSSSVLEPCDRDVASSRRANKDRGRA